MCKFLLSDHFQPLGHPQQLVERDLFCSDVLERIPNSTKILRTISLKKQLFIVGVSFTNCPKRAENTLG